MNALFIEKMISYRSLYGEEVMKVILQEKIQFQYKIIKQPKDAQMYKVLLKNAASVQECLLVEARAAKGYWKVMGDTIGKKCQWFSRMPHQGDCINKLLDIGYHYLSRHIATLCDEIDMPYQLGFFHKAQSQKAKPLVYDCMEWLRPIVVDRALRIFLGKKKKMVNTITSTDIKYFVFLVKRELNKLYYHKKLKYCISLSYWMKLFLLELRGSVSNHTKFKPLFPSLRHETRCKKKTA